MLIASNSSIDSRRYIFSYAIRSRADAPADFPIPASYEGFRMAVFLPRDDPDWFGRSKFPPRIVVLGADSIVALTHPGCDGERTRIPLTDLVSHEAGHILLIGWVRFLGAVSEILLPFNTRSDGPIAELLDLLARMHMPNEPDGAGETASFGQPLDIKFRNHLRAELREGERARAQWFSAPVEVSRRWGPFRVRSTIPGNLVAVTSSRVLWITDEWQGHYERYGSVLRTGPLRLVESVRCQSSRDGSALIVQLRGVAPWRIPVRPDQLEAAQAFSESLRHSRLIMASMRSGANLT